MSVTGKTMVGLVLFVVGGTILLGVLGIHLGGLISLAIAGLIMIYGIKKIVTASSRGQKWFGAALLIFGILMLVGAVHLIFKVLIALVVVYFGYKLLKGDHERPAAEGGHHLKHADMDDDFDKEFERMMKDNHY